MKLFLARFRHRDDSGLNDTLLEFRCKSIKAAKEQAKDYATAHGWRLVSVDRMAECKNEEMA